MRDVIILVIIGLFVFGGDILVEKYFDKSSEELLNYFEQMSGDFDVPRVEKLKLVDKIISVWEEKETPWIIFEYHESINEIEDLVIESYSYYLNGNKEEFEVSYRKLNRLLDDLKNRIKLSFENVL